MKNIYKNFILISITGLFSLVFLVVNANAETYYVDNTGGSDANTGTSTISAWKTLTKVNTAMTGAVIKAGDFVYFKRGETFAGTLSPTVSGTPSNYLTFGAYGTGNKPIINANGVSYGINARNDLQYIIIEDLDVRNASNSNVFIFNSASNFIIRNVDTWGGGSAYKIQTGNFTNINLSNVSSTLYSTIGINLAGTQYTNFIVENSNFTATGTNGLLTGVGNYNNLKILTSTFKNHASHGLYFSAGNIDDLEIRGGEASFNTGAGVYIYQGNTNILVRNFAARNNISNGIYVYGASNKVINNVVIEDSVFTQNNSGVAFNWIGNNARITNVTSSENFVDGFNIHGTWTDIIFDKCVAENNGVDGYSGAGDGFSFHDTSTGTIRYSISKNNLKSAIAHVGSAGVTMLYNVFSHLTNGTIPLVYLEGNGEHHFYNNVVYSGAQTGTSFQIDGPTVDLKNNIFYGSNVGIAQTTGTTTEDYNIVYNAASSSWMGVPMGAHSSIVNPLFKDPASGDFSLKYGSPAIDAGINLGSSFTGAVMPGAWPYGILTANQNTRGSGWEIGSYISPTPSAPTIGSPLTLSTSSIRWNFTDNASDEIGFHLYQGGSLVVSSSVSNLTYLDETGLNPGTSYSGRYVKAYNDYGEGAASLGAVSTSTFANPVVAPNISAPAVSTGGGAILYTAAPTAPPGGFKILINDGAAAVTSQVVKLSISGGAGVKKMAISNSYDFKNAVQEQYSELKNWNLCSKNSLDNLDANCSDGRYVVYVKLYNDYGIATEIISAETNLRKTTASEVVPVSNIGQIISNNSASVIQTFKKDLKPGAVNLDVKKLQTLLKNEGKLIYPEARINGKYDYWTIKAVKRFQAKYKIKANGLFGPLTRAKANDLLSKKI